MKYPIMEIIGNEKKIARTRPYKGQSLDSARPPGGRGGHRVVQRTRECHWTQTERWLEHSKYADESVKKDQSREVISRRFSEALQEGRGFHLL